MRKLASLAVALAAVVALTASPASAATNEVHLCGKTPDGFQVAAGNMSPQFPKTTCAYAVATSEKIKRRQSLGTLKGRFKLRVYGKTLRCTRKRTESYREFRCKHPKRFVLLYKFT